MRILNGRFMHGALNGLLFGVLIVSSGLVAFAQPSLKQRDFVDFLKTVSGNTETARKTAAACATSGDPFERRLIKEYGAIFAAEGSVTVPPGCIFRTSDEVKAFQNSLKIGSVGVGNTSIELQEPALVSLRAALSDAGDAGFNVTPLDGAIAGRRTYSDSVRVWNKRFFPAIDFWVAQGRISVDESIAVRNMTLIDQARRVMEWEERGYLFGTARAKSIFSSTAPPGASHHLALLAIDISEYYDTELQQVLNDHGWYQTIFDDPTHFTYLGFKRSELPERGLKSVSSRGFTYWLPNVTLPSN